MGLLNNIKDHFNSAEFTVAPNKKVKTVCADFKKAFGCTLAIYKGVNLADGELTINKLNQQTTAKIKADSKAELKIKASMKVGEAEELFKAAKANAQWRYNNYRRLSQQQWGVNPDEK